MLLSHKWVMHLALFLLHIELDFECLLFSVTFLNCGQKSIHAEVGTDDFLVHLDLVICTDASRIHIQVVLWASFVD